MILGTGSKGNIPEGLHAFVLIDNIRRGFSLDDFWKMVGMRTSRSD
jgi:hypothetical protein